ncbi:MAG: hypothetical protein ACLQVI_17650 [Polyangiaceae bacterium]|jgi:hypothetical protein
MTGTKRDGAALYRALQEQEALDDLDEIEAMSDEQLDQYVTANGGDPKAIRARGKAHAEAMLERSTANQAVLERLEAFREQAAAHRSGPPLPRVALLARLETARQDPRFAAPVAMLFQKKTAEACTDAELQALVDSIELLAKLEES